MAENFCTVHLPDDFEPTDRTFLKRTVITHQFGRHRITAQVSYVRKLARITQQAMDERQRFFDRQQVIVGPWQRLWQNMAQGC